MNRAKDNQAEREMTSYVLGQMPDEEQANFEVRLLADDSLFEQTLLVKQELIDGYVRHHLDAGTREKFERHILATPEGRKEVAFASALREKLNQAALPAIEPHQFKLSEWLSGWHFHEFVLAGATVLVFIGGLWLWNQNRKLRAELSRLQTQYAIQVRDNEKLQEQLAELRLPKPFPSPQLPQGEITSPPDLPQQSYNLLAINLALDGARGSATPTDIAEVKLPSGEHRPDLLISLGFNPVGLRCKVTLKTPDGTTFERSNVRAYKKDGTFLRVAFPQVSLKPGDYEITIQGREVDDNTQQTERHHFRLKP